MTMKSQRDSLQMISCKGFCVAVLFVSRFVQHVVAKEICLIVVL
jgi:hypothetical protein